MKIIALILALLTLAAVAGSAWLANDAGVPGLPFWPMFLDSHLIQQMMDLLLAISLAPVVIFGLLPRNDAGVPGGAGFLKVFMWIPPLLGLLAALQEVLLSWEIAQRVHVTNFKVVEPSISEALIPLALGLLAATIAAAFLLRPTRPVAAPGA